MQNSQGVDSCAVSGDGLRSGVRDHPPAARHALWLTLLLVVPAFSAVVEKSLRVEGQIAPDGSSVTLQWWQDEPKGPDPVTVSRRHLGQEGAGTWTLLATVPGDTYTDTTTVPGIAYEYEVHRGFRPDPEDPVEEAAGYWTAGVDVPVAADRGIVLLVVDETMAAPLAGSLARLEMDLVGDGWRVVRRDQPRHDGLASGRPAALRAWVQAEFAKNPATPHALFLLGRVPYVLSGLDAPDEHEPVPHSTDLFYADVDGSWSDTLDRGSRNTVGDGILDQSWVPTATPAAGPNVRDGGNAIEMMVGRTDFEDLHAFEQAEVDLLRSYLDRNHAWRHRRSDPPDSAYWNNMVFDESPAERYGLANIVGPASSSQGTHYLEGQQTPSLFGVDFGDWNGANYAGYSIKNVFSINFGSHKHNWHLHDNALRATLAQPWHVLACGWGVRPNWHLHPMALGATIGECHRRIVNNGFDPSGRLEYVPHDDFGNDFRHGVWINLMGDPTLHAFPEAPVSDLVATSAASGVDLAWSAPTGGTPLGYRIFRATERLGPYVAIDGDQIQADTTFTDPTPPAGAWYMVRAAYRTEVAAGSLNQLGQGAFARADNAPPQPTTADLSVRPGRSVIIPLTATDPDGDTLVMAKAAEPENGELADEGGSLVYTPEDGFWDAADTLQYSVWDGTHARAAEVQVTVLPPTVPPSFSQPASVLAARAGDNFTITAGVEGDLPISFQWFKDGVALADGTGYSGVETASLTLLGVGSADAGEYYVELSNAVGTAGNAADPWRVVVTEESLGDALVLHYDFDEGSGTSITDRSPSGEDHDITVPGAVWSPGRFGSALGAADGRTSIDKLEIADSADLYFDPQQEGFTISLWLRTTDARPYSGIFHREQVDPDRRQFKLWNLSPPTLLQFYVGDSEGKLDTSAGGPPLDDGDWHLITLVNRHVGGTWKARLHFDDGARFTEIDSGPVTVPGEPLQLSTPKGWEGQMDDLRIYRKALLPAEVALLHAGALPAPPIYSEWSAGIVWNGADATPGGDPDGDGIVNELEFRLGHDPLVAGPIFGRNELESDGSGDWFVLEFRRRKLAPRTAPWISEDLQEWSPLIIDQDSVEEQILDFDPLGDGAHENVRLRLRRDVPSRYLRFEPYR